MAVAINVSFEYFPIVDARFSWRSGVGDNETGLHFLGLDGNGFAVNAIDIEMYRAHPAVQSRIIVLAAGWNVDQLRFHILGDDAHQFEAQAASGETRQGRCGSDHER